MADEALEKNLRDWFATYEGPLGHEIAQLRITIAPGPISSSPNNQSQLTNNHSLALAHGLIHLTGTKSDGTATDIWYRLTLGLTKSQRDWKIFHTHESVPFLMDGSEKAATHLSP